MISFLFIKSNKTNKKNNGSVVIRVIRRKIYVLEDGRMTEHLAQLNK
jgi:hypothetical protein